MKEPSRQLNTPPPGLGSFKRLEELYFHTLCGSESTETLQQSMFRGIKEVTVVEQLPKLAKDLGSRRWIVSAKLKKLGIATHTATQVVEISEQGVVCENKHGERLILEADTVVLSLGSTPDDNLYQAPVEAGGDKKIVAAGDCVKPQKIPEAIESGFLAACAVEA